MTDGYRVLTCVYCGQEYPQDVPSWGSKVLTDHIKVCEKHPVWKLRKALADLIGASTIVRNCLIIWSVVYTPYGGARH